MKCDGCVLGIGKSDELSAFEDGDGTVSGYWIMQCFVPVEHSSDARSSGMVATDGISYAGIFYEPAITRDSANAILYSDRVGILEAGLSVRIRPQIGGAEYTIDTPSGLHIALDVVFNPLDLDIARISNSGVGSGVKFFQQYNNVYYGSRGAEPLHVGAMADTTGGLMNAQCHVKASNLVSHLTGGCPHGELGSSTGSSLLPHCHVFTSKAIHTHFIADWHSQALAPKRYDAKVLHGRSASLPTNRQSIEVCQVGEEMTALEKHVLFFCGSPTEATHIATATLSFETVIERVKLLRDFEEGSMATQLGYAVMGGFGIKARNSCPILRKLSGAEEGWSIPNVGLEGVARLGIHGSDSGIYDKNGQFDENKFQEMLRITGADETGIITQNGIEEMQGMHASSCTSVCVCALCGGAAGLLTCPYMRVCASQACSTRIGSGPRQQKGR